MILISTKKESWTVLICIQGVPRPTTSNKLAHDFSWAFTNLFSKSSAIKAVQVWNFECKNIAKRYIKMLKMLFLGFYSIGSIFKIWRAKIVIITTTQNFCILVFIAPIIVLKRGCYFYKSKWFKQKVASSHWIEDMQFQTSQRTTFLIPHHIVPPCKLRPPPFSQYHIKPHLLHEHHKSLLKQMSVIHSF